ncbi:MAG: tRNA pseudouridine(55) synthase TruB [Candidatus Binatia bacterium]
MQSGILLIDKPEGPSSAHLVRKVKGILRAKRVGHLGTLDPFASGLLPLGINEGTKVAGIFLSGAKTYRGIMRLGVETETQDLTGKVLEVRPVMSFGDPELKSLEQQFTGDLRQIPPMFSALKKHGVRLYELARQGREIPREPRDIRVEKLRLNRLTADEIEFEVTCSRGTYVRTLAADMGKALGCGAHLKSLRRLACNHLTVEEAVTPDQLERLHSQGQVPLIALEVGLNHLPAVTWESRRISQLRLGQQEMLSQLDRPKAGEKLVRIQDSEGHLVALAEWNETFPRGRWQLFRVFHP